MAHVYEKVASYLQANTTFRPEVGIICGSGLSGLSKSLQNPVVFKYEDIPGFPNATVAGHAGELVFGTMDGVQVVCMRGRFHYYEGNSMEQVVMPVRVMRLMGVKLLIVTNAAGGLNTNYEVGDIMVIQDHFGLPALAGNHPLRGLNDDALGPRFPSISDAYDPRLQGMVVEAAKALKLSYKVRTNGTYCFVSGPCYESKAECRFLQSIGGDSVGMSTVPEVIVAKHCGMQILGLSLVTNKVVTSNDATGPAANHAEVLAAVESSGMHVEAIVRSVINKTVIGPYLAAIPDFVYTPALPSAHAPSTGSCCATAGACGAKKAGCGCGNPACTCGASGACGAGKSCCPASGACGAKKAGCTCGNATCTCGTSGACGAGKSCCATAGACGAKKAGCGCGNSVCTCGAAGACGAGKSCCPACSGSCGAKKCCITGECGNTIVTLLALGAIAGGLFYVLRSRHN